MIPPILQQHLKQVADFINGPAIPEASGYAYSQALEIYCSLLCRKQHPALWENQRPTTAEKTEMLAPVFDFTAEMRFGDSRANCCVIETLKAIRCNREFNDELDGEQQEHLEYMIYRFVDSDTADADTKKAARSALAHIMLSDNRQTMFSTKAEEPTPEAAIAHYQEKFAPV